MWVRAARIMPVTSSTAVLLLPYRGQEGIWRETSDNLCLTKGLVY